MKNNFLAARFQPSLVLVLLLAQMSPAVFAQECLMRAQYLCSASHNTFSVRSYRKGCEEVRRGFKALPNGIHNLACKLGDKELKAQIDIRPPDGGRCMGAGAAEISMLYVNGKQLPGPSIVFDMSCGPFIGDPVEKVDISNRGTSISIEVCTSSQADGAESKETCKVESVRVDRNTQATPNH